jgi:hypothetical protein
MQTSKIPKTLIKCLFSSLSKWVGWINYRIILLLVKQDKQVSYRLYFLLFDRLALYATVIT